ncbi:sodium:solute symporter family protein [Desulfoferula mesophila]|uniref:sodium:solute symporter family protein n=1 Tax=Desulfoferula mesophila TaxID=3058419 RepID=UPI003D9C6C70
MDHAILGASLLAVLLVGLWAGRGVTKLEHFSVAGREFGAWVVFATLSASFIGGGFTMGNAEKVFLVGIVNIFALWGFSLKEVLVATVIAPRMQRFPDAISVGGIMGQAYGKPGRMVTGVFGVMLCAGIMGAQVGAMGYVFNLFLGLDYLVGILIGCSIAIAYSTVGGMRAVVFTDILQFLILGVGIPLTLFLGLDLAGGWRAVADKVPADHLTLLGEMGPWAFISLFLTFLLGETLVPPYVQRLMIGRSAGHTARGTLWSGLFSVPFFAISGAIGLVALTMAPDLDPNLALPYLVQQALPVGLRGLVVAGIIAVVMSSADSFLNGAAVCLTSDVVLPAMRNPLSERGQLRLAKGANLITGILAIVFAISIKSVLGILLYAYNFWAPVILPPLVAAFFGTRAGAGVFLAAAAAGLGGTVLWNVGLGAPGGVDGLIIGVGCNALVFWLGKFLSRAPA